MQRELRLDRKDLFYFLFSYSMRLWLRKLERDQLKETAAGSMPVEAGAGFDKLSCLRLRRSSRGHGW